MMRLVPEVTDACHNQLVMRLGDDPSIPATMKVLDAWCLAQGYQESQLPKEVALKMSRAPECIRDHICRL